MSSASSVKPPAGVRISGTGIALPERIVTNDDLAKTVDTSDEWIAQRTGIRQRYLLPADQGIRQLAAAAVEQALKNANLQPTDLDLLVCATMTPEMSCPAASCRIVDMIGAAPCGAMDISMACTGFVGGLNIAANFVKSGSYRNVAIVGAEAFSKLLNWEDRRTCVLFGDAASAAIISPSDDPEQGCIYQKLQSDGSRWQVLYTPRKAEHLPGPETEGAAEFNGQFDTLHMNGREVYKFAVTTLIRSIKRAMQACDLSVDDVKIVVPHQSNARILESAREKLGLSEDKLIINIERFGNTSAASIGLCLHELTEAGRLGKGDIVIFVGLGGGLTWGTSVWRW